jgi:hypothetical protein
MRGNNFFSPFKMAFKIQFLSESSVGKNFLRQNLISNRLGIILRFLHFLFFNIFVKNDQKNDFFAFTS